MKTTQFTLHRRHRHESSDLDWREIPGLDPFASRQSAQRYLDWLRRLEPFYSYRLVEVESEAK